MKHTYIFTYILLLSCLNLLAQTTDFVTGLSGVQGMALNGNDLYVVELGKNKIVKIDLTADTPKAIDVITGLSGPRQLYFNGNDLYISEYSGNKISKINIRDTPPMAMDVVTGLSGPQGMALNGNDLFIAESNGNKISKIDITDSPPTATDVVTDLFSPRQLVLNGDDLYIAEYLGNKISKIDISAASPSATEVLWAGAPTFILLHENEIYIAEEAARDIISKFDVRDANPTKTDVVTGLTTPRGIVIKDDIIYITVGNISGKVVSSQLPLSTNGGSLTENISLFPNPSSAFVEVSGLSQSDEYIIYNTLGKEVSTGDISSSEKIDVSDLIPGFYILKLGSGKAFRFVRE
ncbi:MAG: T9SS type A sorting domain-containing protein [Flavobacteriaceae bacterium]